MKFSMSSLSLIAALASPHFSHGASLRGAQESDVTLAEAADDTSPTDEHNQESEHRRLGDMADSKDYHDTWLMEAPDVGRTLGVETDNNAQFALYSTSSIGLNNPAFTTKIQDNLESWNSLWYIKDSAQGDGSVTFQNMMTDQYIDIDFVYGTVQLTSNPSSIQSFYKEATSTYGRYCLKSVSAQKYLKANPAYGNLIFTDTCEHSFKLESTPAVKYPIRWIENSSIYDARLHVACCPGGNCNGVDNNRRYSSSTFYGWGRYEENIDLWFWDCPDDNSSNSWSATIYQIDERHWGTMQNINGQVCPAKEGPDGSNTYCSSSGMLKAFTSRYLQYKNRQLFNDE